ncbi:MAG: hypothetical protein ABFD50_00275 [Smithella sp.]
MNNRIVFICLVTILLACNSIFAAEPPQRDQSTSKRSTVKKPETKPSVKDAKTGSQSQDKAQTTPNSISKKQHDTAQKMIDNMK